MAPVREPGQADTAEASLEHALRHEKALALDRLAGGVAHELNNLLAAQLGYLDFLLEDLAAGSQERHFAEQIQRAAERGQDLVRRLVVAGGRTRDRRSPVDLAPLVAAVAARFGPTLPGAVAFRAEPVATPLVIAGSAPRIEELLGELLENAREALGPQGGAIGLALERHDRVDAALHGAAGPAAMATVCRWTAGPEGRPTLVLGALAGGGPAACLAVRDDGVGIAQALQPQIFDPFYTTKHAGGVSGLGLAVVRGIVISHGGAIRLKSQPGSGSLVEIFLPLAV